MTLECNSDCLSCSGPSSNNCLSCQINGTYLYYTSTTLSCTSNCTIGYYGILVYIKLIKVF